MPQLILIRHGNTFEAGETPRMVGARTDMPLTKKGEEQAAAAAAMIADRFMPLGAVLAGPLTRTKRTAEIILSHGAVAGAVTIDGRLREIDYGLWENKTSDEVRAAYGPEALEGWEKRGEWPEGVAWTPAPKILTRDIREFLADQHKALGIPKAGNRIAVTSNGILRFVYHIVTQRPPSPEAKVATGHYCVLSPAEGGEWTIEAWDMKP